MLVCPQCQFENPTANNFCQKCGTSLTHNTCPECNSLVEFDQINCQTCGAVSGVVWWVVISPDPFAETHSDKSEIPLATGSNGFLDIQQRYQLLQALPPPDAQGDQELPVLDCQPFQLSLLETLILPKQLSDEPGNEALGLDDLELEDWAASLEALEMPVIVQPYIALRNEFYTALPAIHNAWQWHGQSIVLLEDRSNYPQLTDVWSSEAALPLLQILQWLYEMVELWQGLEPWGCQQSLLVLSNLRVDAEDQILCLQRLYANPERTPPDLQKLGHAWQTLFAESQKTHVEAILQLLGDLENGVLTSPDAVKSRIEAIAQSLQTAPLPTNDLELKATSQKDTTSTSAETTPMDTQLDSHLGASGETASTVLEEASPGIVSNAYDNDEMPTIVLPMQLFNLEDVGRTDVGRQRDHNEDYFGIETQVVKVETPSNRVLFARNVYILCDGMGGHAGGEVASALAVDTIRKFFQQQWQDIPFSRSDDVQLPTVAMMTDAVLLANKVIYDVNQQNARSGSGRMGTTLAMMVIHNTEVAIAHVGDSRLYRYTRKRGLEQITVDHEVGQREIQRGVDPDVAYSRPDAYQLTQALGPRDEHFVKPDVQFLELNEDMLLLLCSDGLSDNDFLEKHVDSHVQPLISSQTNLDKGVGELIEMANRYNGHDNITAIAVRVKVRPSLDHLNR
jgi:protein phosphatase